MAFAVSSVVGATPEGIQPMSEGKGFTVGNSFIGSDGRKYVLVTASATIASASPGTEVTITEPAFTAAAGSGGFRAPDSVALASGEAFWAAEKNLGNGT